MITNPFRKACSIIASMAVAVSYITTSRAATYSISPNPATVNENAGHLNFTVSRSSSSTAATVYASTVQDQGYSNNGYYVGLINQIINFSAGQSTAQVSVTINDLGLTSGSETFRLIVQQNSTDPVSTYLATDNFTIVNNDVVQTTYSISPNPASVNENAGHLNFTVSRSSSSTAGTVYASTVQDQGYSNNGYYVGLINQVINFSAGQSAAQVSLTIIDAGLTSGSENFRLIVQQNPTDPITTYLASDVFTIVNNDSGPGPSGPVVAGFDREFFPDHASTMDDLLHRTNLRWCGYYLSGPSQRLDTGWLGQRSYLETSGWKLAPIYVGQQDPNYNGGNLSYQPSALQGTNDGNEAVAEMGPDTGATETVYSYNSVSGKYDIPKTVTKGQGFKTGTIVYLDWESANMPVGNDTDYVVAWCLTVAAGGYQPGIYCHPSEVALITSLLSPYHSIPKFWVANWTQPSVPSTTTQFLTTDPTQGQSSATSWQYGSAYSIETVNGLLAGVDLDTSSLYGDSVQMVIGSTSFVGNTFSLSIQTVVGLNYTLEYKTSLSDAQWNVAQTLPGNGGALKLSDSATVTPTRFYRLHVH